MLLRFGIRKPPNARPETKTAETRRDAVDSIADLFAKGGIYIYPLILCSVLGLAILLQKLHALRLRKVVPPEFVSGFYEALETEGIGEAESVCRTHDSPAARIALAAVASSGKSRDGMREAIEDAGKAEAHVLGRYIETLLTISSISTLIGLLGTISGMIKVFAVISEKDIVDPPSLAGGISEALYTTALGLTVAIPALISYKYSEGKCRELVSALENEGKKILEVFSEKKFR